MKDAEAIELMQVALNEIQHLKSIIADLAPKAEAYINIATVLRFVPHPREGCSPDIAWLLKNRIGELKAAMFATPDALATPSKAPDAPPSDADHPMPTLEVYGG